MCATFEENTPDTHQPRTRGATNTHQTRVPRNLSRRLRQNGVTDPPSSIYVGYDSNECWESLTMQSQKAIGGIGHEQE